MASDCLPHQVRERPWGRVLCVKSRGYLLRLDTLKEGWARLEADFTEEGQIEHVNAVEDDTPVLEGWVRQMAADGHSWHLMTVDGHG